MLSCLSVICWLFCTIHIVAQDVCYNSTTFCQNSWIYSPETCKPELNKINELRKIYNEYCKPHDRDLWKRGVQDGSSASSDIDYNFIICKESFSLCGYVPLKSTGPGCGEVMGNSGVTFGVGIDLGHQSVSTLQSLGVSQTLLAQLTPFIGLTGSNAAEAICNSPLTNLDYNEVYDLSIAMMNKYAHEMETWYNAQKHTNTKSFDELPKGIRTVLTSIHFRWGATSKYPVFWNYILSNNFEEAITELRSWYSGGQTDRRLREEANIMAASLGCMANIDCVFLLDESGSVGWMDFDKALVWVNEFVQAFDEGSLDQTYNHVGSRFGVATFSYGYKDHIYLKTHSISSDYENSILSIPYSGGSTMLGSALTNIGANQFVVSNGMRPSTFGIPRLLIVLTDGRAGDDVVVGVESLSHLNLNIIAIGIGNYNIDQLEEITTDDFIFTIDNYDKLSIILSGVLTKSCYVPTKLNLGDILKDLQVDYIEYFEFSYSGNDENVLIDIQQNQCVYVYVSFCTKFPSYYVNDVEFALCAQPHKQIVLDPKMKDCSEFESQLTNRRLQDNEIINIYVAVESRSTNGATFDMVIDTCDPLDCKPGTNIDNSLPQDDPYDISDTYSPTNEPTTEPTKEPTINPSNIPSIDPTNFPSNEPSHSPTTDPTAKPTPGPTVPDGHPSRAPTLRPTATPTPGPTVPDGHPSRAPTSKPTKNPTIDLCPTYSIHNMPCKCVTKGSMCQRLTKCYYDQINSQCKLIDELYCSTFLNDIYKPCQCFNNDKLACILFNDCFWDQNRCKPNGNCSFDPPTKPSKWCCNAHQQNNNGICKAIKNENDCILNDKCLWDFHNCLDEPCLGKKRKCASDKDCCSGICVRFKGIQNCV